MTTQAISAYGVQVRLGDGVALAPIGISAVSNTTPIDVITSVVHGIPVGQVDSVVIAGVTPAAVNGTWIVQALDAGTLRLRGSVAAGVYGGGGTITRTDTYTVIAELTNIEDTGIMATLIETTAHDGSGYASRIPTFLSGNTMRLSLNWVPGHPTHDPLTGLMYLLGQRVTRHFMIVWPDAAKTAWFMNAWVVQDRKAAPVAGALTTSAALEVDGAPILAAA